MAMKFEGGSVIYQFVVDGELGDRFAYLFEGMTLLRRDGQTYITGPVVDQAQLFGLIDRIQETGLTLVSVDQPDRTSVPCQDP